MFYKFMLLSLIFKILFLGLPRSAVFSQQQRHCIKQSNEDSRGAQRWQCGKNQNGEGLAVFAGAI